MSYNLLYCLNYNIGKELEAPSNEIAQEEAGTHHKTIEGLD